MLLYTLLISSQAAYYDHIYSLGDLTDQSSQVFTAQVNSIESFERDGLIYSTISLNVNKTYVGMKKDAHSIEVIGGTVGDLQLSVSGAPLFAENEEKLIFLEEGHLVGFGQGSFEVREGRAIRDATHMNSNAPSVDFNIEDTLPDEHLAQDCLETIVHDDYDEGWHLRTLDASNAAESAYKAYPLSLIKGMQYEIVACADDKVQSIEIAVADDAGNFLTDHSEEGREVSLEFFPEESNVYYMTVTPTSVEEGAVRAGVSIGLLYK